MGETETLEPQAQAKETEENSSDSSVEQKASVEEQSALSDDVAPKTAEDSSQEQQGSEEQQVDDASGQAVADVAGTDDLQTDDADAESGVSDESKPKSTKYKTIKAEPEKVEPAPPKELDIPDVPEIQRILRLEVPIIVRLAEKMMKVSEILDMNPGMIIEFDKTVDEPLDLMINNKCIGEGQTVKVGENFGLKVTKIIPLGQIIQAMGKDE